MDKSSWSSRNDPLPLPRQGSQWGVRKKRKGKTVPEVGFGVGNEVHPFPMNLFRGRWRTHGKNYLPLRGLVIQKGRLKVQWFLLRKNFSLQKF